MEECKHSQLTEDQDVEGQLEDVGEEGLREYLYLDREKVNLMRLSGLSKDLYMKLPDGTRSKRNGGKVEMTDSQMLEMVERNKRGLESGRFD